MLHDEIAWASWSVLSKSPTKTTSCSCVFEKANTWISCWRTCRSGFPGCRIPCSVAFGGTLDWYLFDRIWLASISLLSWRPKVCELLCVSCGEKITVVWGLTQTSFSFRGSLSAGAMYLSSCCTWSGRCLFVYELQRSSIVVIAFVDVFKSPEWSSQAAFLLVEVSSPSSIINFTYCCLTFVSRQKGIGHELSRLHDLAWRKVISFTWRHVSQFLRVHVRAWLLAILRLTQNGRGHFGSEHPEACATFIWALLEMLWFSFVAVVVKANSCRSGGSKFIFESSCEADPAENIPRLQRR